MRTARFISLLLGLVFSSWACSNPVERLGSPDAARPRLKPAVRDAAVSDTSELDCLGPNPSVVDNPGSYCTQYCTDVFYAQECIEGAWRCPVPNAVLARDCTWGDHRDIQMMDLEIEDASELEDAGIDAELRD